MRLAHICPTCRELVPARSKCPRCTRTPAEKLAAEPWRRAYNDPAYKRNRLERYRMAGGKCESCGAVLEEGHWQCDHHVEVKRFADPLAANHVNNLRVYCTGCHSGARKPKG